MTVTFPVRLLFYVFITLLIANINPLVDAITHPEIPYFDEEHLIVGFVAGTICVITNTVLEIFLRRLATAISKIKTLESYLSICANCKKIGIPGADHTEQESWMQLEAYLADKTHTQFSHGICPDCVIKLYPELADSILSESKKIKLSAKSTA